MKIPLDDLESILYYSIRGLICPSIEPYRQKYAKHYLRRHKINYDPNCQDAYDLAIQNGMNPELCDDKSSEKFRLDQDFILIDLQVAMSKKTLSDEVDLNEKGVDILENILDIFKKPRKFLYQIREYINQGVFTRCYKINSESTKAVSDFIANYKQVKLLKLLDNNPND